MTLLTLGAGGAWAQPVTVTIVDGTNAPFDYFGSRSTAATPNTLTSNATSGLERLVLSAPVIDRYKGWWNLYCLALKPSAVQTDETVTITAPMGYVIMSINMIMQAISSNNPYDITFNGSTTNVTGASSATFTASNVIESSFSFTIKQTSSTNNWLAVRAMTVTLAKKVAAADVESGKSYMILPYDKTRGALYVANGGSYLDACGGTAQSANNTGVAMDITSANQQFGFVPYNEKLYLYNVGTKTFPQAISGGYVPTGNTASNTDYFVTIKDVNEGTYDGYSQIWHGGTQMLNISTGWTYGVLANWNQSDAGNNFALLEAGTYTLDDAVNMLKGPIDVTFNVVAEAGGSTVVSGHGNVYREKNIELPSSLAAYCCTYEYFSDADCTEPITNFAGDYASTTATVYAKYTWNGPVKYTATTSAPEYYNLNIRSQYLVYNSEATGEVALQSTSEPFNNDASWAFIGDPHTGFKLINKANGTDKYLTYTSVVTGGNVGKNNIGFVADGSFNDEYWVIDTNNSGFVLRMKENTSIYFHHDSTNKFLRTCSMSEWSAVHNDAGSTIIASTDEDVLFALYDSMKDWSFGTSVGQMHTTDAATVTDVQATSTLGAVGTAIAGAQTSAYPSCYTALLTVKGNTALVEPTAGLYRLKNVATGKYLNATALSGYLDTNKYVYANGDNTSAATVIQLKEITGDARLEDGIYMYNQGYGFGWVVSDKQYGAGLGYITTNADKYVHWFPGKAANQIAFAICLGNGTGSYASYLKKGIYTADTTDESVIGGTDETADAAQWVIEAATSVTVNMNSDGAEPATYYATFCAPFSYTVGSGTTAYTLEESGDWLIPTAVDGEVAAGTPVLLKGTSGTASLTIGTGWAATPVTGTALTGTYLATSIEGANDYVLGISEGVVGFYHWKSNDLAANRAYIDTPESPVKGFVINWDNATGIQAMDNGQLTNAQIYNLAGQRLSKLQKGVNIVSGKKVLVK
ncbi:MAG: hypothetical protein IJ700_08160 [Bacteroidaceae bacterium]|nr:hypothetical protein [Bacteroidaceae bacterium]